VWGSKKGSVHPSGNPRRTRRAGEEPYARENEEKEEDKKEPFIDQLQQKKEGEI